MYKIGLVIVSAFICDAIKTLIEAKTPYLVEKIKNIEGSKHQMDILIFDYFSLKKHWTETISRIEAKKILIDTGLPENEMAFLFANYKLDGIISNSMDMESFIKMVECIARGEIWIPRNLVKKICNGIHNRSLITLHTNLTPRELEIIKEVCYGKSNEDIAKSLCLSVCTVKKHINNIFKKLGLKSRLELLIYFRDNNIIA